MCSSDLDADQRSRISNTPGLAAASGNARGTVWQLADPTVVSEIQHRATAEGSEES